MDYARKTIRIYKFGPVVLLWKIDREREGYAEKFRGSFVSPELLHS